MKNISNTALDEVDDQVDPHFAAESSNYAPIHLEILHPNAHDIPNKHPLLRRHAHGCDVGVRLLSFEQRSDVAR